MVYLESIVRLGTSQSRLFQLCLHVDIIENRNGTSSTTRVIYVMVEVIEVRLF